MKTSQSEPIKKPCEIAIIGIGCNYPGAKSPKQFWENILSRKQQFREMPDCRLPQSEYYDPDPTVADKSYQKKAAVLDGYQFDWLNRKIPKSTYESTDIVHWLALDTALQALADTRISQEELQKETTGVVLGNTLTGEFTRSNHMLLRWPYVKRALQASLRKKGLTHLQDSLEVTMEQYYKSVFAPVTEDTLAGGLANTIAGRVCNYLDINGGGYIVDGACSSSLLAITSAANYLELGQMDMVIAGGVDISLDTFELIGFAKTGALTRDEMRVYDKQGKGFIPGEGCGVVVLKRLEDAIRDNNQVYAVLKGWGISSDGKGGITAPSSIGQARALKRAYTKAGFNPDKLNFIEGHGTGTTVGDKVELEGISMAIQSETQFELRNCGVTSLKSIVGHTKAAAGVGAFIKTVIALNRRVIPPTAGLNELNPIFNDKAKKIYPVLYGKVMDPGTTMYAGVSAMGFGGINSHVLLQSGDEPNHKFQPSLEERKLMVTNQSHELILFAAKDTEDLIAEVNKAKVKAKGISYGELAEFASYWNSNVDFKGNYRASIVTTNPFELETKFESLLKNLQSWKGEQQVILEGGTLIIGRKKENLRIGGLYPGQGSQRLNMAFKLVERFDWAREMVKHAEELFAKEGTTGVSDKIYKPLDRVLDSAQEDQWKIDLRQTNIAQPAITLASLLWHKYMKKLGIDVSVATGHSLGELMAFHAAGLLDEDTVLQFAAFRGKSMANCGSGTMASLVCPKEQAEKYIKQAPGYVDIANINANDQTVISGEAESIDFIIKLAESEHIGSVKLPVSAAFHSKLIGDAATAIQKYNPLKKKPAETSSVKLISSVSGQLVDKSVSLNDYFSEQCIKRVSFIDTINSMKNECDVMVEIGSGKVLAGLSENIQSDVKSFPVEARVNEEKSFNVALANLFVMGVNLQVKELYQDRLIRDFVPASQREFIVNPCERPFPAMEDGVFQPEYSGNSSSLLQSLELSGEGFEEYMRARGGFVRDMIQADMRYFQPIGSASYTHAPSKQASYAAVAAKTTMALPAGNSVKEILFKKIESVTGFPSSNFTESMKLLDDFNLDSIKAGSVLNDLFKSLQIVGKINPSNFLNASLESIRLEIEKFRKPEVSSAPTTTASSATDVEDFVYNLLAEKTGFPRSGLQPEFRLLNDLNLDSIKAGSLLGQLVKKYNLQGKIEVSAHANASIAEIIGKIKEFNPSTTVVAANSGTSVSDIQSFVFNQIQEKTGFPLDSIKPEFKLLDDLNLDSIKAGSLIAGLLKHYNLQGKLEVAAHANASLSAIVNKIVELIPATVPQASSSVTSKNDIASFVFGQIQEKTGFPLDSIKPEFKLLDDLNLDSIKANSFIAGVLKHYQLQGKLEPVKYSNASLTTIIEQISTLTGAGSAEPTMVTAEPETREKVFSYVVNMVEESLNTGSAVEYWKSKKLALVCASTQLKQAELLKKALSKTVSVDVISYENITDKASQYQALVSLLPYSTNESQYQEVVSMLSKISHCTNPEISEICFVQLGNGVFARDNAAKTEIPFYSSTAFAASLHLERPGVKFRALEFDASLDPAFIGEQILSEFVPSAPFYSAGYTKDKTRSRMMYELTENTTVEKSKFTLTEKDVVLVTGGAKGITAECAIRLAEKYKCRMALVGSSPYKGENGEIKTILEKYEAAQLKAAYYSCNISDANAVKKVVEQITSELGVVTGIVHGAGKNVPRRSETVSLEQALDEISPKINGALNVFQAVNPKKIKCFVAFSSIIGVTGMAGNSWYAFSNETLDLFLRHVNKVHGIATTTLAYSIWSEVGMGERMGSTHALARMGIGAISPADGVGQFMNWVDHKSVDQQIVIAASMGGMDTWVRKPYPTPDANRYLESVVSFEPGTALKIRTVLSQITDVYIEDHDYKGSLLFPTVFGLEAMTQTAAMVVNIPKPQFIRLEDVSLLKPIVVPQNGETEIEIHAEVLGDPHSSTSEKKIKVGISTEHSGFTDDHFSAVITLGGQPLKTKHTIAADKALPIIPKADLYGSLLFQGPRFQLMEKLFLVSDKKAVFATSRLSGDTSDQCFSKEKQRPLILGSPLLRDTLLQSVQLMLTQKIVLPIGIQRWEINYPENQPQGGVVECALTQWDNNTGLCDVTFVNDQSEIMEKIEGYKVKAMAPYENYPSPSELNQLNTYVSDKVKAGFSPIENLLEDKIAVVVNKHSAAFETIPQTDRRNLEQSLLIAEENAISGLKGKKLVWDKNGKPGFDQEGLQISISHSKSILLMTLGQSIQGCDIEMVEKRSASDWEGILDSKIKSVATEIAEVIADSNLANTMLWGIQEVCIKAFAQLPVSAKVIRKEGSGILLDLTLENSKTQVYSYPVNLYPGTSFAVSILVNLKNEAPVEILKPVVKNELAYCIDDIYDPKAGKFVTQFFTAFKDCRGFHAKTYFVNFPHWMGNLREYILSPVKKKLLKDLGSGEFGMVTNNSTVHIYEEAETLDKITGRLWITDKSDLKNSLIDLGYEWLKHTEDGKIVKIGECALSTTWVKIEDRGIVKLSPIPDYFYKFLDEHILLEKKNDVELQETSYPTFKDLGELHYKSTMIPRPSIVLNKKTYHTGIYNANTVGNLYYSNYYDWQAKNIESYLFGLVPETYLQNGRAGEYICLETNVNHLQEAMPFEEIETVMYLEQLYDNGVKLYFEYFSLGEGSRRKLAYGYNYLLWAKRKNEDEIPVAIRLPERLNQALRQNLPSVNSSK